MAERRARRKCTISTRSEAACEETGAALRDQGDAGVRDRRHAVACLDGGRPDFGGEFQRWRQEFFRACRRRRAEELNLDWGPDARPKIAIDRKGGIALAFSIFRDKAFNGQVLYTRSDDGGKSFAAARPITASNESQRFEAIGFDKEGAVFAAWLDKRNRVPAQQSGKKYDGAALFFASSKDGGATYSDARMAIDNTCECCRLGLAFDPSEPSGGRVQEHL